MESSSLIHSRWRVVALGSRFLKALALKKTLYCFAGSRCSEIRRSNCYEVQIQPSAHMI